MTLPQLARLLGCSRQRALVVVRELRAAPGRAGAVELQRTRTRPYRRWRVRAEVVAAYVRARGKSPEQRVRELEQRVLDLEERLSEHEARVDRLLRGTAYLDQR